MKVHLKRWHKKQINFLQISAVPDLNDTRKTRILAVEVRNIDEDGRVAIDGRIKVGDQITDINHRPVYQVRVWQTLD